MYSKSILTIGLFSLSLGFSQLSAQNLFTVGKQPIPKSAFLEMYQKNNAQSPSYDKASLEDFVNLFALYKMKVMEANALQLDTIPSIKSDIDMYKSQLAKSYITDNKLESQLLHQAYDHTTKERAVAHILLTGFGDEMEYANKHKLDSLAQAINLGKISFEDVAKKYSLDRATASEGGYLGYIHAFQTPYEFEEMVYNTPVGQISKPFKSSLGYHMVKVLAERPALGSVEVAQILLTTSEENKDAQMALAQSIIQKLKSGSSFEQMVQQYSEDIYSNKNNGVIKPIASGSTDENIENAVFKLKNTGDISQPIVSSIGIHIFKLIKKVPLGTFEQEEHALGEKVDRYWSKAINERNLETTKKLVGFKEYPEALEKLINAISNDDFEKDSKLGSYPNLKLTLLEIYGNKYTQQDFLSYIQRITQGRLTGNKVTTLKDLYRVYTEKMLAEAQVAHLEKTNPEFKKLAEEYTNGVLIFDLMEKNIWNKASEDSLGLQEYYKKYSSKYQWEPGFKGEILQSKNHEAMQQILESLKEGSSIADALKMINTPDTDEKIYQQTGRFNFTHIPQVDKSKIIAGKYVGILPDGNGGEFIILADEVYNNPQQKTFLEARDKVVEDYQSFLEKNWNEKLKEKYPLKVNSTVLNSMVK
ncbi:MAG TPA: peptidylprolyl isomerase [Edaphocola sp.]|nr:peptidylprolyl isomerase [Edaphocola sp.]